MVDTNKIKRLGCFMLKVRELRLKVGSQVMLVNNDQKGRWFNGSIGHITDLKHDVIIVQLANKEIVDVCKHEWDVFKYEINEETNGLNTIKVGSFTQYPMRLAWALTVHKSQGKTFDNVIVDIETTFSPGQMYVALSRCTNMEGLILKKKITSKNIFIDNRIVDFEREFSLNQKTIIIKKAISDKKSIEITYLKTENEKVKRIIKPLTVGEMCHQNKKFIGMDGFCVIKKEPRCFSVARILEINVL